MWTEYLRLAYRTFTTQKKRTALTLIGIFIGITAVVSLISLGQGLQNSIQEQFELLGTDKIFVMPGSGGTFDLTTTTKLTQEDMDAIDSVSGVDTASSAVYKIARAEYKGETDYTWIIGMDASEQDYDELIESFGVEIEKGRGAETTKDAVAGYRHWQGDFFEDRVEIGDKIEIEGNKFKVTGGVSEIGNPQDDSSIYITLEAAQEIFDIDKDELDYIFITVKDGEESGKVAEEVKKELRDVRDVEEGEEDFTVQTAEDFMETFGIVLTVVQIVLIGIAGISLLVGGVNIANTMYTTVMERTREIGIMKAIGARNSDVFFIFLVESGLLGVVGGLFGIGAGIGMSQLVGYAAETAGWGFIQTVFPWYLTFGALMFSFLVGAIAGTLPAIQASKLKPVDALRYE